MTAAPALPKRPAGQQSEHALRSPRVIDLGHAYAELRRRLTPAVRRQALTFVGIGAAATALYLGLYLLLRPVLSANAANIIAQLVSTLARTAGNRRFTLQISHPRTAVTHHLQMTAVFGFALGVNWVALTLLDAVAPDAGHIVELALLSASGLLVTALRIAVMARWHRHR